METRRRNIKTITRSSRINLKCLIFYDAIIVGGGPAGLSAAIYLARAKFSVLVIEKEKIGGQITITSEVVNYPGILQTSGQELTEAMRQQAQNFRCRIPTCNG